MTTRTVPILLIALTTSATALTACRPRPKDAPPAPPAAVPAGAAAATPARRAEAPAPTPTPTLGGLLASELETRPAVTPAVEQVASALQQAGVTLTPMKQVLARTVGARYCAASTTSTGLAVAVCEFASDAEADRGIAFSRRTFDRLIPGRRLARNRMTVLTLTPASADARAHAQAERVAATFATL